MGLFDTRAGDRFRDQIAAAFDFQSEDDRNLLSALHGLGAGQPIAMFQKAAAAWTNPLSAPADDTLASTANTGSPIGPVHTFLGLPYAIGAATARQIRVVGARLMTCTATGLALNDTNYATLKINSRTAAGASQTLACQSTTRTVATDPLSTGTWPSAVGAVVALSDCSGGSMIPAGGSLDYSHTKTGTGVVIPGCLGYVYGVIG